MERLKTLWGALNRKKEVDDDIMDTSLSRCLTTFDLTLLGIGHMVGAGIYVVTATVMRDMAGPAVMLSYLLAGVAAFLASLCYAEYGARVPKAGAAYSYTYVCLGEIWAFITGWNIILECIMGSAAIARTWSSVLDSVVHGAIKNGTLTYIGRITEPNSAIFSEQPDFVAVLIIAVLSVFVASGAKISMRFNNVFTTINLIVIVFVIVCGFCYADITNVINSDHGGFLPFGISGVFRGAAICFFSYVGFDGIATAGEEAADPQRSIPVSTVVAMAVVTAVFVLASSVLALLVPYYDVDVSSAYPEAFAMVGAWWIKYVVVIGSMVGMTTSLLGMTFSIPRAIYAMADDGLMFKVLAQVNRHTQTPIIATITGSTITALLACFAQTSALVEMLSIGSLLAYTIVAGGIIILRYLPEEKCPFKLKNKSDLSVDVVTTQTVTDTKNIDSSHTSKDTTTTLRHPSHQQRVEYSTFNEHSQTKDSHKSNKYEFGKLKSRFARCPILRDVAPGKAAHCSTGLMVVCMFASCVWGLTWRTDISKGSWWAVGVLVVFLCGVVGCFVVILLHRRNDAFLTFQIPCVPLLPSLSMLINILLMTQLPQYAWLRVVIWGVIGLVIYFTYGIRMSNANRPGSTYSQIRRSSGDNNDKLELQPRSSESEHPYGVFR